MAIKNLRFVECINQYPFGGALKSTVMKTRGIKSVVSEFNNMCFQNFARIFWDTKKNEVYMLEYVDYNSGLRELSKHVHQIAQLARRSGKITMKYVQNCINECNAN